MRVTMRRITQLGLIASFLALLIMGLGISSVSAQTTLNVLTLNVIKMRKGPNATFAVITTIPTNTTLVASARTADENWALVNYNGQMGWIYTQQLRIKGNFASLPVSNAPVSGAPAASGGGGSKPGQPTPSPTSTVPPNGTIISLDKYASTNAVDYYRLVYYSDGLKIRGYYAEPKAPGRYPAVIYNRGGFGSSGMLTGNELPPFAESGFVAVGSQYRGSAGSEGGEQFGGADVDDVLSLIPLLRSRDKVDGGRIVMFGTSRGGMMTFLSIKAEAGWGANDIKAAVTVSPVTDLIMWQKEQPAMVKGAYSVIGDFATHPELFVARSATYWPQLINIPLLIEHGDADGTVNVDQAIALDNKIKGVGGKDSLIIYPGDGHGLLGHELGLPEGLKWFQRYIGGPNDNFDYYAHYDAIHTAWMLLKGK